MIERGVNRYARPHFDDWCAVLLLGATLGMLLLGFGARLGMRLIAFAEGRAPSFSLGGSLTVVFLGTVVGALVAALFLLCRTLFPQRRIWRTTLFWVFTLLFVLRGLNPVTSLNAAVFLPLFALHGGVLTAYWYWRSRELAERRDQMTAPSRPAITSDSLCDVPAIKKEVRYVCSSETL